MSYILDALKKAEAEEDPDLRASLELNQQKQRQFSWGLHLIAVALIGNLAVLLWLFGPQNETSLPDTPAESPELVTDKLSPASPAVPASEKPATAAAAVPETASTRPPVKPEPTHTNLAGLNDAARARFPELSFSTHVYAADAALRAVVVNGERMTEGDRLGSLTLTNITETGVVFRFENYLVSVSVLDDWD